MTNTSQVPRADDPALTQDKSASLETLIVQAERAVIERDQRVRLRAHALGDRLAHGAGRKLGIGVAAAAGGLVVLGFLRSRWRRSHPPRHAHVHGGRHAVASGGRMAGLVALLLPLLPRRWQMGWMSRLSPGGRAALVGLVLPLVTRLFGGGKRDDPPMTAGFVDLERYAGDWYEIARLPSVAEDACASDATAHYRWLGDGLEVVNRCLDDEGREVAVHGEARVVDAGSNARLEVSFAPPLLRTLLPFVWTDYWVLDVDPGYRHALVGTPDREYLWLLSRTPRMDAAEVARLLEHAERQGYDTARVVRTPQLLDERDDEDDEREFQPSARSEAEAAGVLMR